MVKKRILYLMARRLYNITISPFPSGLLHFCSCMFVKLIEIRIFKNYSKKFWKFDKKTNFFLEYKGKITNYRF